MPPSSFELPLQVVEEDGRTLVRFPADTALSEVNVEVLSTALLALITRPQLTVDLATVAMLTSVILEAFLAINNRVRAAGGQFTLLNPNPTVHQVFKVTRLDTILDVQPHDPIPA